MDYKKEQTIKKMNEKFSKLRKVIQDDSNIQNILKASSEYITFRNRAVSEGILEEQENKQYRVRYDILMTNYLARGEFK